LALHRILAEMLLFATITD